MTASRHLSRSDLRSFGPLFVVIAAWAAVLGLAGFMLEPGPVQWSLCGLAVIGALGSAGALRRALDHDAREHRIRAAVDHERDELERERRAFVAHVERERATLNAWTRELTDRATEIGRSTPNPTRWSAPEEALPLDAEVRALISHTSDRVFEALRDGKYVRQERMDGSLLAKDLMEMVRGVASIYQDGDPEAWTHVDAGRMAHAVHRAATRLVHRLGRLPGAPSTRDVSELQKYVQGFQNSRNLLEQIRPYAEVAPKIFRAVKLVAGANPIAYTLTSLATDALVQGGKELSRRGIERALRELLGSLVEIIGDEAALLYGGGYGRRDPSYVLAAEAMELARRARSSRPMLEASLKLLSTLPLRDELERRELLEGLRSKRSPDAATWLPLEAREEVMRKIEGHFEAHPHGMSAREVADWRAGLERRLELRSQLGEEDTHHAGRIESAVESLVGWSHARGIGVAATLERVEASGLLESLVEADRAELLGRLQLEPPVGPIYPRFDLSKAQQDGYLEALSEIMTRLRPWGPQPDVGFLEELARRFRRADAKKLEQKLAKGYEEQLGAMLGKGAPSLGGTGAFCALAALEPDEVWTFAHAFPSPKLAEAANPSEAKAWIQSSSPKGSTTTFLMSTRRCVALRHGGALDAPEWTVLWTGARGDPTLRIEVARGWLGAPSLHGGVWLDPPPPGSRASLPLSKKLRSAIEPWLTLPAPE